MMKVKIYLCSGITVYHEIETISTIEEYIKQVLCKEWITFKDTGSAIRVENIQLIMRTDV